MNRIHRCARVLLIVLVALASGCATNTITGRSQLMLMSEESAIQGAVSAYSSMIGEFSKKNRVEVASPRVTRVREITNRLIAEAVRFRPDSAGWGWEVQVIDEPKTVNAFCMAGGKMGIYTGFWEKLKATDDEIANVMGHEIGHALASHTREKMSMAMTVGVSTALLAVLASSRNSADSGAYNRTQNTMAMAAALAITLPNSREAETEADPRGFRSACGSHPVGKNGEGERQPGGVLLHAPVTGEPCAAAAGAGGEGRSLVPGGEIRKNRGPVARFPRHGGERASRRRRVT
jgi:Zn-dependent protease with chaperone function